jgi:hypothetical protein
MSHHNIPLAGVLLTKFPQHFQTFTHITPPHLPHPLIRVVVAHEVLAVGLRKVVKKSWMHNLEAVGVAALVIGVVAVKVIELQLRNAHFLPLLRYGTMGDWTKYLITSGQAEAVSRSLWLTLVSYLWM